MVCIVKSVRPIKPVTAWGLQQKQCQSATYCLYNLFSLLWLQKSFFLHFFKPTQNVIPKHFDQPNMKKIENKKCSAATKKVKEMIKGKIDYYQ